MQKVSQSDLLDLPLSVPPLTDQAAILDRLAVRALTLDELVAKARELIWVMKERRSALISAAVTGQLDIDSYAG